MEDLPVYLQDVITIISYILVFVIIILIAKWVKELISKFDTVKELVINDNPAFNVSYAGYMLSVSIVFIGALVGPESDLLTDLGIVFGFAVMGVILLNISVILNDKFLLHKFSNTHEIVEKQNVGVGVVQFASYLASALIIAGSIVGEGKDLWFTLILFLLGQISLIGLSLCFNAITPYSIHKQLENLNLSAGISFAGKLIGSGIILLKGAMTVFTSWWAHIQFFLLCILIALMVQPLIQFFLDKVIIPESRIIHEIKEDRNMGVAFLEMVFYISFALLILFLL
ncbi:MAG: DUF350 domain-containing protein [Cytophagales bacterium]|nr:DUF350 domain-containing protein [Cytophagales bacterium]